MNPGGVLVIGLDGGTLDVIGPLAERGVMPAVRDVLAAGRPGTLRSTLPWYTVPGWTTLMTGVTPARHGLLHWVKADPGDYFENRRQGRRFLTSADIEFPTFWDVAGAAGRRVAVVNMPLTYPAWPVNGSMITGLLTPRGASSGVAHPADLLARFPGYEVDLSTSWQAEDPDAEPDEVDVAGQFRELVDLTEGRRRVGTALVRDDVDLGVVVFVGPDRISHKAWREQERVAAGTATGAGLEPLVEDYYRALDRAIGDLVGAAGDNASVLIVSDHGFGPPAESTFGVNAWLRQAGYLRARAAPLGKAVVGRQLLSRLRRPVARWVKRRRRVPLGESPLVDWSASSAYGVHFAHARMFGVVLNRAGVKREGWVSAADAPRIMAGLRRDLEALTDQAGRRVVRRVYTAAELDATAPAFPDLLVETEDPFYPAQLGMFRREVFEPNHHAASGLHHPDGIFAVAGPRVSRGADADAHADIADVAPTVLGLLGIEAPSHIQGRARGDLFDLPLRIAPPSELPTPAGRAVAVSVSEQEEIEAHLRSLGYTE